MIEATIKNLNRITIIARKIKGKIKNNIISQEMVDMKGNLIKTQKIIQDAKGMNTISVQEIRNLTETTRKIINQKVTNQEEIMIRISLMEKQEMLINNKRIIIVEDTKDSVIIVSHQESIKIISQTDKTEITEIIEENNRQE